MSIGKFFSSAQKKIPDWVIIVALASGATLFWVALLTWVMEKYAKGV